MRASLSRRALAVVLLVSFGVTCAAAGSQAVADQYKPQVGQDGKDVVWVPSPDPLVDTMLDMAKVTANDYVMDLGSGDGRTVIAAARRGARAVGVEYNPDMVALSRRNATAAKVGNKAEFVQADLFETDLSKATVITMFLLPQINLKLRPKILQLKPGTRIVSNTFTMDDWKADETKTVSGDCTSVLHGAPLDRPGASGRRLEAAAGSAGAEADVPDALRDAHDRRQGRADRGRHDERRHHQLQGWWCELYRPRGQLRHRRHRHLGRQPDGVAGRQVAPPVQPRRVVLPN